MEAELPAEPVVHDASHILQCCEPFQMYESCSGAVQASVRHTGLSPGQCMPEIVGSCRVWMQGWQWAQDFYAPDQPHWGYKSLTAGDLLKINVCASVGCDICS